MPAITDSCFQLKLYCSTGVSPRGAQVRARQGRSSDPIQPCRFGLRHAGGKQPPVPSAASLQFLQLLLVVYSHLECNHSGRLDSKKF
jgi:hypothetical protein